MFYALNTVELFLLVLAVIGGAAVVGSFAGHYLRHSTHYREPIGVVQAALLGVVGLILAFGLTLAVGRYQSRRADVVDDANTIGTAYLRAQTLHEPQRSRSLTLFKRYNDLAIRVTHEVPGTAALRATSAQEGRVQRGLWRLAGQSLNAHPIDSAPRLYVESLNEMIDQQGVRLAGLNNRVPNEVLALQLFSAALGIGLLALVPQHARQGPGHGGGRRGRGQLPRLRHLRPRPADARADHRARHAARQRARRHGAAAGGAGAGLSARRRQILS